MRKSVKILFGLFACLAATTGHAQKVVSENGKVIIDSSAIPHVTTKKARTTTATSSLKGPNTADDIASVVSNSLGLKSGRYPRTGFRGTMLYLHAQIRRIQVAVGVFLPKGSCS